MKVHVAGRACRGRTACRGFTLVEMVVALVLLGLVLVGLYAGLRTALDVESAVEQGIASSEAVRIAQGLLRAQLGTARPQAWARDDPGERRFEGERTRVRFIAALPGHAGRVGLHVQEFAFIDRSDAHALVFRHGPLPDDIDRPDPPVLSEDIELLDGLVDPAFEYLDQGQFEPEWVEEWARAQSLPPLVRVRAGFGAGPTVGWPDLYIALRLADAGGR